MTEKHPVERLLNLTFAQVLGAPGCGKGTRCKIIHDEKDYTHLSVGDHVRYLATAKVPNEARGGLTREELQVYLDEMELVPAATIVAIIKHQIIMASEDGKKRFLIDGFPRNEQSAKLFEEEVGEFHHPARLFEQTIGRAVRVRAHTMIRSSNHRAFCSLNALEPPLKSDSWAEIGRRRTRVKSLRGDTKSSKRAMQSLFGDIVRRAC